MMRHNNFSAKWAHNRVKLMEIKEEIKGLKELVILSQIQEDVGRKYHLNEVSLYAKSHRFNDYDFYGKCRQCRQPPHHYSHFSKAILHLP